MKKKSILLLVFALSFFVGKAQVENHANQGFSLSEYLKQNQDIQNTIVYQYSNDTAKIESLINDLIEDGNLSYPDIYESNLSQNDSLWAYYPDSIMWQVYYSYIAFSIYMDYSNKLPWKLSDLRQEERSYLFDKYTLVGSTRPTFRSTPTSPVYTYKFLIDNNIIGRTRLETIERLLQWCRYHLSHFGGKFTPINAYDHWQYNGYPPVERVLDGTTRISDGRFYHHTAGCSGTACFLKNVLRIINIPVYNLRSFPEPNSACLHTNVYFPSEKLNILHGDDPYGIMDEANDFEIPIGEILITDAELDSIKSIGFEGIEITRYTSAKILVKYLPITGHLFSFDSSTFYANVQDVLLSLKIADSTDYYEETMQRARERFCSVDLKKASSIYSLWRIDSVRYNNYNDIFGFDTTTRLDTVLIPYNLGYANIVKDTIVITVTDTVTEIAPVFFLCANAHISTKYDSILYLDRPNIIKVTAEDAIHYHIYYIKGVLDDTEPLITSIHHDQIIDADHNCTASLPDFTGEVTATDDWDTDLVKSQIPPAGKTISGTNNNVTLTVTDDFGNTASAVFNIEVVDTIKPNITCVKDTTNNLQPGRSVYTVSGTELDLISTTDNCGIASVLNNLTGSSTLKGTDFPIGTTTVVWTVMDKGGNLAQCSFEVTVNDITGIESVGVNGITLYPNPTDGIINYDLKNTFIQRLRISDITGVCLIEKSDLHDKGTIDLSQLVSGLYIVCFEAEKENYKIKLVKE